MALLLGVLKAPCVYCAVSAFISACLAALVEASRARQLRQSARRPILVLSVLVAAGALAAGTTKSLPPGAEDWFKLTDRYKPEHPPVLSESSAAEIALAKHLRAIGAKVYTAWWCPHCQMQRENFGKQGVVLAPFVECSSP